MSRYFCAAVMKFGFAYGHCTFYQYSEINLLFLFHSSVAAVGLTLKNLHSLFLKLLSFHPCPPICSVFRVTNRANNLLRIKIVLQRFAKLTA